MRISAITKTVAGLGSETDLRADKKSALIVTQSGSRYGQAVLDGNVYIGSNALGTPVTTQAGLSATSPALTLYNPINSGVNLVLLKVNIVVTTAPAANTAFSLANNIITAAAPSSVTDATIVNAQVGKKAGNAGLCYKAATLAAAPIAFRYLGGVLGASSIDGYSMDYDINGEVVIPPGVAVSIQSTTAAAILASMTWEEVGIN